MHLSAPVTLATVRSRAVVLLLLMLTLSVYVHSSFASILMGKREPVTLLCLSYWCLVIVVWLFLTTPRACLQFVIVVFLDHTHLLFSKGFHCDGSNFCRLSSTR